MSDETVSNAVLKYSKTGRWSLSVDGKKVRGVIDVVFEQPTTEKVVDGWVTHKKAGRVVVNVKLLLSFVTVDIEGIDG